MKVLKCLVSVAKNFDIFIVYTVITRGGVEDTRLEAKAKDIKNIRGQGEPLRGQTLSRPSTEMLEAKDIKNIRGQGEPLRGQTLSRPSTEMLEAKDQGHKLKCSQKIKKKIFAKIFQAISKKKTKIFQAISKKKGLHKNFSGDLHKKTFSKKFFRLSLKF